MSVERFRAAFEAAGMHQTRPRRLIAERLVEYADCGVDFATDELWREVQSHEPRLGRATVYRMVEALVQLSLLDRVTFADGTHRYRVCSERHHHHLTCVQCHQVVELPVCLPASQFGDIARQTGFAIEGHALEVFGRCPDCRSAAAPQE
jgi:Fur family ferric uptake transcriptional regulator